MRGRLQEKKYHEPILRNCKRAVAVDVGWAEALSH